MAMALAPILTFAPCGPALHAAPPLAPPALGDLSATMQASLQLPGTGVQMVELADRVVYIAGHGRYLFTGPAWDLWHGARLDSVAQATELAGRINMDRMALDPAELGAFPVGELEGAAPVWGFVDPLCADCQALLHALQESGTAAQVVLLPLAGKAALDTALRLVCAPSRGAAWSALLAQDWATLPEPAADCDPQPLVRALITGRLLGIDAVPTLIAPDGRLHRGAPADLTAWLAGE